MKKLLSKIKLSSSAQEDLVFYLLTLTLITSMVLILMVVNSIGK